jgi:phospholipase/carboxylesterase
MTELLPCVEIDPPGKPIGTVLWLHGLGASGHDFEDIVPMLELGDVRFVFPHAPKRPVTINGGLIMPAWYDILMLGSPQGGEEPRHVRESAALIETLLARERERGMPASSIVLAGFSQGAAMALLVGVRHAEPLLGIMVLSGYELLAGTAKQEATAANQATPVLFCHGTLDPVVEIERGRRAHQVFAQPGRPAAWHEFPHGHEVSYEEVAVIRDWLHERFSTLRSEPTG